MHYLFYEKETDERAKVVLVYHVQPPKELTDIKPFIIVENIPEAEQQTGKTALPYCNPQTGEFWYEYIDRPLTAEEKLEQLKQSDLDNKEAIATLYELLLGGEA